MERLTYRNSIGGAEWMPYPSMSDARDKLCAYEDAEENGTLVRPKGFCCDCRELILHENANVYAECPKVGTKFKPFELDTRKHFCDYFVRKALKEREITNEKDRKDMRYYITDKQHIATDYRYNANMFSNGICGGDVVHTDGFEPA